MMPYSKHATVTVGKVRLVRAAAAVPLERAGGPPFAVGRESIDYVGGNPAISRRRRHDEEFHDWGRRQRDVGNREVKEGNERRGAQAHCMMARPNAASLSKFRTNWRVTADHTTMPRRCRKRPRTSRSSPPRNPRPLNGMQATYSSRILAKWPKTSPDSALQKTSQGSPSSVRP